MSAAASAPASASALAVVVSSAPLAGQSVSHVFGDVGVLDDQAARLAVLLDPRFLAECGWDPASSPRRSPHTTCWPTRARVRALPGGGLPPRSPRRLCRLLRTAPEPVDRDRRADPGLDEARWRRTASPVVVTGQVSLPVLTAFARHAALAVSNPESEKTKDVWELAVFGLRGRLNFTAISQPWLREAAKRWATDELPRRRGDGAASVLRSLLAGVVRLSQSLRGWCSDPRPHPARSRNGGG